jgi:hypothetical protein
MSLCSRYMTNGEGLETAISSSFLWEKITFLPILMSSLLHAPNPATYALVSDFLISRVVIVFII